MSNNPNIYGYSTYLFDCDGVLLDSNRIKSDAFYEVALQFGADNQAQALRVYHETNGGISRFEKFRYYFQNILNRKSDYESDLNRALETFATITMELLLSCPETDRMRDFLDSLPTESAKYIVSGGSEVDLVEIFEKRKLSQYFDGIFGSPKTKHEILKCIPITPDLTSVFLGDSRYDAEVAKDFQCHFVFVSKYTEFNDWNEYFPSKYQAPYQVVETLADFLRK
ncbi:MAG: HAD family hydrolase [Bdellovibrionales bacterium]|nr:HAD family hydrolase [Bdellovibrionales bacterium]